MTTSTTSSSLRYLLDSELQEELTDAREWIGRAIATGSATLGQIGRQRRHLEAVQAEVLRRASMTPAEAASERARQEALEAADAEWFCAACGAPSAPKSCPCGD